MLADMWRWVPNRDALSEHPTLRRCGPDPGLLLTIYSGRRVAANRVRQATVLVFCWGSARGSGGTSSAASKCKLFNVTTRCYRSPVAAFTQFSDWAELAVGGSHVCAPQSW